MHTNVEPNVLVKYKENAVDGERAVELCYLINYDIVVVVVVNILIEYFTFGSFTPKSKWRIGDSHVAIG